MIDPLFFFYFTSTKKFGVNLADSEHLYLESVIFAKVSLLLVIVVDSIQFFR